MRAPAARCELRGGARQPSGFNNSVRGAPACSLSRHFRAGEMVFFIPWRVVAEESGAAHYGFGGAMLLDLLGPRSGCWPHDGEVAGGAESTLVIFRFGATMELGRSGRSMMMPRRFGAAARAPSSPRATINAAVETGTIDTREGDDHRISGSVSYWWKGGGDGSVHSSVVAPGPQGLAAARSLRRKACATPKKTTSVPKPDMFEPIDEM